MAEEEIGLIQGQEPDSKNEYYIAQALEKFKLEYMYQFLLRAGSRTERGAIVVDFLVFNPFGIPVQVYGEYWHSGERSAEDRLQEVYIQQYFGREVVAIMGTESDSRESAEAVVQAKLL